MYMTKEELIGKIKDIVDNTINGTTEYNGRVLNGHPAFYLIHSREEFEDELSRMVKDKDNYDRYDLFYYGNSIFKYMLDKYDSHTSMMFMDSIYLPVKIRIFDGVPYIVDSSEKYKDFNGSKITKINDVMMDEVISGLKNIICYSSDEYLKIMLEEYLENANVIRSLPDMKRDNVISFSTDKGDIKFELDNIEKYEDLNRKPNYNIEVNDNTAIITYNSCKDEDKMIELVSKLKNLDNIENYIVDLRGNRGGRSSINNYLIDFLDGKNVVALCDERVFSSARMCLIDLKNIGAKVIGTNPGTPISCFGNAMMQQALENEKLRVIGSVTYWYYDENYKCKGIFKEDFEEAMKKIPNLLEPVFFNVDEKKELTLEDYLNNKDSVLEYASTQIKTDIKSIDNR